MTEASMQSLIEAVSAEGLMRHVGEFARRIKLSGTPEELESFRYLQAQLDGYGYRTKLMSHDAYISLPGTARLAVGNATPHCITHSFSRPTPEGGLSAPLVYVKTGAPADIAAAEVRGKIILVDGIATPAVSLRATAAGAAGQLHISPHDDPHEMCISAVWGSPTDATRENLPGTVVLSIGQPDGAALKSRLAAGERLTADMHAEVDTGWRKTPILQADLAAPGAAEGDPFVMFSGHHDTWYYGVMDNGSANATMLECARLYARARDSLRRGLRFCFWSGHSHGRYSGSTWYADTHWDELNRRCIVHVNADSTGGVGATVLSDTLSCGELRKLAREAVGAVSGQELTGYRMSRAGDQSFWGVGIPAMYMGMSEQPAGEGTINPAAGVLGGGARKGAGFGWWWHTPHDLADKIDPDNLVRDTRVYVHTLWRLLTDAVVPLDYRDHAGDLIAELGKLAPGLGGKFDLAPLRRRAEALRDAAARLTHTDPARANAAMLAAGRALVPLEYTAGNRFDHDPALGQAPWPCLDALRLLAKADGEDEVRFHTVSATRAGNRLGFALDEAARALVAT